jgi:predicted glycoside hydrolase/deacetylase ChbG (UPF0249 family)
MRYPVGPWVGRMGYARTMEKFILERLAASVKGTMEASGIKFPENFFGLAQTGALGPKKLSQIIRDLPDGTSEIMCHPGLGNTELMKRLNWGRGWDKEFRAVTDEKIKALLKAKQVELINFSGITA